jgi:hypothetical protein
MSEMTHEALLAALIALIDSRAEHFDALAKIDRALSVTLRLFAIAEERRRNAAGSPQPERRPRIGRKVAEPVPAPLTLPASVSRDAEGRPTLSARSILLTIAAAGPVRPGDLAMLFKRSPHGMRWHVAPLVKEGLLVKTGTTQSVRLAITELGRQTLAKAPPTPPPPRGEAIAPAGKAQAVPKAASPQQPLSRTPEPSTAVTCIGPGLDPRSRCPRSALVDGRVTRRCDDCIREHRRRQPVETFETVYSGKKGESLIGDRPGASSLARNT